MAASIPAGFHALPLPIIQLSLAAVLKCGQSFRWSVLELPSDSAAPACHLPHEYRLCLKDRVVCLRQSTEHLFYRSVFPQATPTDTASKLKDAETLLWLRDYFQLDVDLVKLYREWAERDPVFLKLQDRFSGIRMLRQDPWENLVSFICSSNNNISRITKMVQSLCKEYSPPLLSLPNTLGELETYHPFPPPSVLAAPEVAMRLRALGFGYRADFIQKTAKMLVDAHGEDPAAADRWLGELRTRPTNEAREEVLKFMGVGRKVADCVLLMSLDKREVIPVDTHVHQIAAKHYGLRVGGKSTNGKVPMTPKIYDEVNTKLAGIWGEYAGWAHSVLFTSDLRAFATYGLETPTPTKGKALLDDPLPTPPITPSPAPTGKKAKRKAADEVPAPSDYFSVKTEETSAFLAEDSSLSLAERIKTRKRKRVERA
ncbi:DNA glycosylase [Schizophyllum commune Tattone D]|nr:DNA glycosylase [Schizophyllum commune Tattone D]